MEIVSAIELFNREDNVIITSIPKLSDSDIKKLKKKHLKGDRNLL